MKKSLLLIIALAALTACNGTKHYDAYVETLKAQPAIIDTISSPAAYANYLLSLDALANEFEARDVKLDETQTDELNALSADIQAHLQVTYNRLAQTPMLLDATDTEASTDDSPDGNTGATPVTTNE